MLTSLGRHVVRDRVSHSGRVRIGAAPRPDRTGALVACAFGISVAVLFASAAIDYLNCYSRDPNLEHAPLVLVAALWLAWRARGGPPPEARTHVAGVGLVALGIALELGAWFSGALTLELAALIVVLLGTVAAAASVGVARRLVFPAGFLLFAAPLPAALYEPLALRLQAWVCVSSAWVLQLLGVAVFRQGSLLHLPGHTLDVGLACAGVRQASSFLALSLAAGYLSGRRWGYRAVLTFLALPIALAANVARVLMTAAIVSWFGPRWAAGVWHDLEGTTLVACGVLLVWLSAYLLARWPATAFARRQDLPPPSRATAVGRSRWRAVVTVLLVGITLKGAAAWHVAQAESTPGALAHPLDRFPSVLGDWRGTELPIPQSWGIGEHRLRREFRNVRTGDVAVVWAEYSSHGADRRHHPEVCMAVEGMREDVNGRCVVPLPGHPEPAQRFRFVGQGRAQVVYYWHYSLPSSSPAPLDAFQRLHDRMRAEPASITVEVFTPRPLRDRDAGVSPLPALVDRAVQTLLPAGAVRGHERKPVFLINGPYAGVWN